MLHCMAVNRVIQLGPEDQVSMLEVISVYFTSQSQESDESLDSDSDDEDMPVTISMHTEYKINYFKNYYYKKHNQ